MDSDMRSPEEQAAIAEAARSPELLLILEALTSPPPEGAAGESLRGGKVSSDRPHLQALQNLVGWTIGGYDTRPFPETKKQKEDDRLQILLRYRQPADPGDPPEVAMYDYLCETLFGVPMRPVGPEVVMPRFRNLEGEIVDPEWVEADWDAFRARVGEARPTPVLLPNRYPYQLPRREGVREEQQCAQHYILWYFHYPEEPLPDPEDAAIDADIRRRLVEVLRERGLGDRADYIWYRNPSMSVPQVFHVQVFWIVPNDG
mmetsp:Transcript_69573/g.201621  ORF Transcript_69573/g.201621 Transcript_69573/m.201621 type:complete len:259 (+) Transcript_69573:297-1073(+)